MLHAETTDARPTGEPRTFYVENTNENIPRPPQAIVLNNIISENSKCQHYFQIGSVQPRM
jgi:hypothetical protein